MIRGDGTEMLSYETLQKHGAVITQCGSRVTCSPPPGDADYDYLIFVENLGGLDEDLKSEGWEPASGDYPENDFSVMKKSGVDYIMTSRHDAWKRHIAATHVCKQLNLSEKKDRIAVFPAVLYGKVYP